MRSFCKLAFLSLLATMTFSCLGTGCLDRDKERYDRCDTPVLIVPKDPGLVVPCTTTAGASCMPAQSPEISLPRGKEVKTEIEARDAEGDLCDPSELEVAIDDPSVAELARLEQGVFSLRGLRDAYTSGSSSEEPETALRLSLGEASTVWSVVGVFNLEGRWLFESTLAYPDPAVSGPHRLYQQGRRVFYEGGQGVIGFFGYPARLNMRTGKSEFDAFMAPNEGRLTGKVFVSDQQAIQGDLIITRAQ